MAKQLVVTSPEIIYQIIKKNGAFPNNPTLPLLLYKKCLNEMQITPTRIKDLFFNNNWENAWDNGIYSFHHFHSNTHEVLGIYEGMCEVQIGGNGGQLFLLEKGDVLIIPAGVSHKNEGSSADFKCIGAYPSGVDVYDMHEGKREEYETVEKNIQSVGLPKLDPVYGRNGPLFEYWHDRSISQ